MQDYFKNIPEIQFEGENSDNPLAFKFYDENKTILGKSMKEHFRFATCYWHTFTWPGLDPFGGQTFERPWMGSGDPIKMAEQKLNCAFDFFTKIFTPSLTNSTSSLVIATSSDLLKPPEKPTKIKALSLNFFNSLTSASFITLIINFKSLNNIGFFAF